LPGQRAARSVGLGRGQDDATPTPIGPIPIPGRAALAQVQRCAQPLHHLAASPSAAGGPLVLRGAWRWRARRARQRFWGEQRGSRGGPGSIAVSPR